MTHFASDKNDFQGVYQFIQLWIPCSLTFFDHGSHEWSDARQCDKHVREVVERKTCSFFSTPVRANYIYISLNPSLSHHFQTILYPKPPKLFSHFYAIISIITHSIFNFSLCFFHPSKICPPFLAKGRPSEMRSSPPGVKLSPIFFRAGRPDFSHENRDLLGNTLGNLGNYSWCILVLFKILTSDIENWGWLNEQNIWI